MPRPILDFADIYTNQLSLVGGKAVNLGVMTRAGLPVPPGVCVTTEAYRQVAGSTGLENFLNTLATTQATDTTRLGALAGEIRAALLITPVPEDLRRAVVDGYAELGANVPVAVRSSATAEDLSFASFAGQHDTYLNVVGADAVIDAVRRCWASLWTDRAVAYRSTNGIDHKSVLLAVVIQRMVNSATAGVLFTANPVTGRQRQAVIDASLGLGEAVVSGAVNPDHFVVETATGEIIERRLGDKRMLIRARPEGGTEHVQRARVVSEACITDDQIRALTVLGDRVEQHYGAPQDTEWAIDGDGRVWLTQARPITTLYPLPVNASLDDAQLHVYFCFSLAQGLYRPITPMGLATFRLLASAVSKLFGFPVADPLGGPVQFATAGERVFIDLTGVLRSSVGRVLMPRMLDVMEARSAVILRWLCEDPRLPLVRRSRWSAVRRALRIAARFKVPVTAMRALVRPEAARRRAEQLGLEIAKFLVVRETASSAERLDFVEQTLLNRTVSFVPRIMPAPAIGFAMLGLAEKLMGDAAKEGDLQAVLRGLAHNVTTEMDLSLWALASRIRSDKDSAAEFRDGTPDSWVVRFRSGTLPAVLQHGLTEFLGQFGHRAVAEIDVGMPRWSDDPLHLRGVLANYLRLENEESAPDAVFARGRRDAEAMIETLTSRARQRSRLRARMVRFALDRARALTGLRELPKYYLVIVIAAVRKQLQIVGAELAAAGHLDQQDDVFFADLTEVRAGLGGRDLRGLVATRKATYERELRRRHIPRVLLSDGTEPEALLPAAPAGDGSLAGTPASAGTVTAPARVIIDPVGAHLEPGEILVAPSTDPGWTPLFLTAGGLVMEMGGANSHGAVVAREYGIPAVVGVPNATARITTGQHITVDGGAGTVTVR